MKKLIVLGLVAALASIAVPAQATPSKVNGSFVQAFQKPHQPHRAYFQVEAGKGSKECEVTLRGKTLAVTLGTDKTSSVTHIWYVKPVNATKAVAQAKAAPSPTSLIVCSH